jgi:hypothetical protein
VALPELQRIQHEQGSRLRARLSRSLLFRRVDGLLDKLRPMPSTTVGGKRFPTYLSGEDSLGMEVLVDYESPEWRWLRSIYDELGKAVRADGAGFGIIVNPLGYQLTPDYPFDPGPLFARYCGESGTACFDMLPTMREHRDESPFVGRMENLFDVWHYSPAGHRFAGHALTEMLLRSGLLPAR